MYPLLPLNQLMKIQPTGAHVLKNTSVAPVITGLNDTVSAGGEDSASAGEAFNESVEESQKMLVQGRTIQFTPLMWRGKDV